MILPEEKPKDTSYRGKTKIDYKHDDLPMFILYLIAVFVILSTAIIASTQAQVEVLQVRTEAKVVQSDVDQLYYIQCVDRCNEWYALADIADLYLGFNLQCDAINYYKQLVSEYYGDTYVSMPCPPQSGQ